jgi:hypothetical protein
MRVKYIVVDNLSQFHNTDGMIIFPEYENHLTQAHKNGGIEHVISAGFCSIGSDEAREATFRCYGSSTSLKKSARPEEDSIIFERMFKSDY